MYFKKIFAIGLICHLIQQKISKKRNKKDEATDSLFLVELDLNAVPNKMFVEFGSFK